MGNDRRAPIAFGPAVGRVFVATLLGAITAVFVGDEPVVRPQRLSAHRLISSCAATDETGAGVQAIEGAARMAAPAPSTIETVALTTEAAADTPRLTKCNGR
jgi:hypothetical protein